MNNGTHREENRFTNGIKYAAFTENVSDYLRTFNILLMSIN